MDPAVEWFTDPIGVLVRYPARITGVEIIELLMEIQEASHFESMRYFIGDRTDVTEMLVSQAETMEIAHINREARKRNPDHFLALISPSDLIFGLSRQVGGNLGKDEYTFVCRTGKRRLVGWMRSWGWRSRFEARCLKDLNLRPKSSTRIYQLSAKVYKQYSKSQ